MYVLDTAQIKGKNKKLSPPWKGPGIILKKFTPYVYRVKLQRVIFTTNHDRLKPCNVRKIPAWLQDCRKGVLNGENLMAEKTVKSGKIKRYCICKGPDTGEMMVQCDNCKEWFHLTCVNLSPNEAETLDT